MDADVELLRVKGEAGKVKVGRLKVGGEAFLVSSTAIEPDHDVAVLGIARHDNLEPRPRRALLNAGRALDRVTLAAARNQHVIGFRPDYPLLLQAMQRRIRNDDAALVILEV